MKNMKNIIKLTTLGLVAAALITTPVWSLAQDAGATAASPSTNAPAVQKKKNGTLPFKGKLAAVNATAGTFTVGELNLNITSTTKISTNAVPATLADFKVGDNVTGAYKKTADGTLNATTLKLAAPKKKPAATE
jgi:hypothetical protein